VGPQGAQGPQGDTGITGAIGEMGFKGDTGPTGPVGPRGAQGATGDDGNLGSQGLTGLVGPRGNTGPIGPDGSAGAQGPQGTTGSFGTRIYGLDAVRLATATGLPAYSPVGSSSLLAAAAGPLSIDGVAVAAGNRVLVKDESCTGPTGAYNGLYAVTAPGSTGTPDVPSVPAPPVFTGTTFTVGAGQTYSTLALALDATSTVVAGSRLEIHGALTEIVTINRSLEIFSTDKSENSILFDTIGSVINIISTDPSLIVYIHDLTVINNNAADTDSGGNSACITVNPLDNSNISGPQNIYIDNCILRHPRNGIVVWGHSWTVSNSTFNGNVFSTNTTLVPIRARGLGSQSSPNQSSFISNNTFNSTAVTTSSPTRGTYPIVMDTQETSTNIAGWQGNMVIRNNTIIGTPTAYINVGTLISPFTMIRQSGSKTGYTIGNDQLSLHLIENNFSVDYNQYPVYLITDNSSTKKYFDFFKLLNIYGNQFGRKVADSPQYGALLLTAISGSQNDIRTPTATNTWL
jgi:hypothetical protein